LNEASQKELSLSWAKEREELKKQMNDMRSKAEELESAINAKEKKIKELVRFPFNLLTYLFIRKIFRKFPNSFTIILYYLIFSSIILIYIQDKINY
jgi:hypothetical protein